MSKTCAKFTQKSIKGYFDAIRDRETRITSVFKRFGDFSNMDCGYCFQITSYRKIEIKRIIKYYKVT